MDYAIIDKNFRAAVFNQDLIVLSFTKNRYYLIPNINLDAIHELGEGYISKKSDLVLFNSLHEIGALSYSSNKMTPIVDRTGPGFFDPRWTPPPIRRNKADSSSNKIMVITYIIVSGLIVKFGSFRSLAFVVKALKYFSSKKSANHKIIEEEIITSLTDISRFFWLDFSKNKCLTYSCAQMLLLRRYAHFFTIVVGVRTRPFCSHAWVEYAGLPIGEDGSIRDKLSPILEF